MSAKFKGLSEQEKLQAENEFLKMKLMLEKGAKFGTTNDGELPGEIENYFLKTIMEYEKQFDEHKTIKVFDKIGRPAHFGPVAQIGNDEIDHAWKELNEYLSRYGIDLSVCSPNIPARELYRFATEELFDYEMDDMDIPGMTTAFIYDEFYPDPVYDNSKMVEYLFSEIFRKPDLFSEIQYETSGFIFNDRSYKDPKLFFEMINRFKSLFDEIILGECKIINCMVNDTYCEVNGNYCATAKSTSDKIVFQGGFKVELFLNDIGYWNFKKIRIDGFNPGVK